MSQADEVKKLVDRLTKMAADEGRLIELGWLSFRLAVLPPECSDIQVKECRRAFMAGAQHLFGSIMTILEPGTEATDRDVATLTMINEELALFVKEVKAGRL
jgi:hypothetical protein